MARHPYIRPVPAQPPEFPVGVESSDHRRVLHILRTTTGVDFSNYRQTTVKRRIARRMALRKVESLRKYTELLRKDPGEVHALHEDILITVTAFFRDPEVFQSLQRTVFPSFVKDRGENAPIRVWVPGCSTGEEVYSLAIALFETLEASDKPPTVQIFATDVSDSAIDKARAGVYLENAMVDVSPERRRRFFRKTEGGWQISKAIRDVCVFARQNVTSDPPFSNLDLVSCRNLLIYLEPILQKRVVPIFHYALRPLGSLVLGNAETITGFSELFLPIDRNHRIFAKRPGSSRQILEFGQRHVAQDARGAGGLASDRAADRPPEGGRPADSRPLRSGGGPGQRRVRDPPVPRQDEPVPGGRAGSRELQHPEDGARGPARRAPELDCQGPTRGAARAQGGTPGPTGRPRSRREPRDRADEAGRKRPLSLPGALRRGGRKTEGRSRPDSGNQVEARRPCRTRQHRQARTGADGDQGLPAGDHRGAGGFQRGAQERQRRDPFRKRRAPVDQRGARDRQGGAPVDQRGAHDGQ